MGSQEEAIENKTLLHQKYLKTFQHTKIWKSLKLYFPKGKHDSSGFPKEESFELIKRELKAFNSPLIFNL